MSEPVVQASSPQVSYLLRPSSWIALSCVAGWRNHSDACVVRGAGQAQPEPEATQRKRAGDDRKHNAARNCWLIHRGTSIQAILFLIDSWEQSGVPFPGLVRRA